MSGPELPSKAGIYMRKVGWEQNGWTATPNALSRDERVPWDAKGAYTWIASHQERIYELNAETLAAAGPSGRDHAYKMLRCLEQHGWLTRQQYRAEDGRGTVTLWDLHFAPVPESERTWKPSQAKKRTGKLSTPAAPAGAPELLHVPEPQGAVSEAAAHPGIPARDGTPEEEPSGIPARAVPARAGIPYKEEKTNTEDQEELSSAAPPPRAAQPTTPRPEPPPRVDVEKLCHRLRDRMIANGCRPPTITKAWRDAARLLLDKDGRDLDKALNLLDWATQDEFWMANIQSMPKFRAQYDVLRLRATREHRQKQRAAAAAQSRLQSRTSAAAAATSDAFARYRANLEPGPPVLPAAQVAGVRA